MDRREARRTFTRVVADALLLAAAVVAFCLIGSMPPIAAEGQRSGLVAKDLLAAENRDIAAALAAIHAFVQKGDPLDRKGQVSKAELDEIVAAADAVKRTLPQFQRAASTVVTKLQGAGKWTSELDTYVENQFREPGTAQGSLQALQAAGGARAALQKSSRTAADATQALDKDLASIRGKSVAIRLIEELVGRPVSAALGARLTYCQMYLTSKITCSLMGGESCTDVLIYGDACRS